MLGTTNACGLLFQPTQRMRIALSFRATWRRFSVIIFTGHENENEIRSILKDDDMILWTTVHRDFPILCLHRLNDVYNDNTVTVIVDCGQLLKNDLRDFYWCPAKHWNNKHREFIRFRAIILFETFPRYARYDNE